MPRPAKLDKSKVKVYLSSRIEPEHKRRLLEKAQCSESEAVRKAVLAYIENKC